MLTFGLPLSHLMLAHTSDGLRKTQEFIGMKARQTSWITSPNKNSFEYLLLIVLTLGSPRIS